MPRAPLACLSVLLALGCAGRGEPPPDKPLAILEESPHRYYEPLWPLLARARADEGPEAIHAKLREQARGMGADAILIEHRWIDPSPAPGDEREVPLLGNAYPPLLEKLEPGALPHGGSSPRVYGPTVVVEGLAIRYRDFSSAIDAASDVGLS